MWTPCTLDTLRLKPNRLCSCMVTHARPSSGAGKSTFQFHFFPVNTWADECCSCLHVNSTHKINVHVKKNKKTIWVKLLKQQGLLSQWYRNTQMLQKLQQNNQNNNGYSQRKEDYHQEAPTSNPNPTSLLLLSTSSTLLLFHYEHVKVQSTHVGLN